MRLSDGIEFPARDGLFPRAYFASANAALMIPMWSVRGFPVSALSACFLAEAYQAEQAKKQAEQAPKQENPADAANDGEVVDAEFAEAK